MQNLLRVAIAGIAILILGACTQIGLKKKYSYIPPEIKSDRVCISRCLYGKTSCERLCDLRNERCLMATRAEAEAQYRVYQQTIMQSPGNRHADKKFIDFAHAASCYHPCNCVISFNTCYTACGGQVIEHS